MTKDRIAEADRKARHWLAMAESNYDHGHHEAAKSAGAIARAWAAYGGAKQVEP